MKEKKIAIVISLSSKLTNYCKALVTSIRYYNQQIPIIIIKDGNFRTSFLNKIDKLVVVNSLDINELHKLDLTGLLTKLNILYLSKMGYDYDCYIHMDADSIVTNCIDLELFDDNSYDFHILQGRLVNFNIEEEKKLIKQYAFNPIDFPEYNFNLKNLFFFSSSHIAIYKSAIPSLIDYLTKHRFEINKKLLNNKRIRFNDQGFLNLIINVLSERKEIKVKLNNCGIYGKDSPLDFPNLYLENIIKKKNTGVLFIHYTGPSRKLTLKAHNFGDILEYFVKLFYKKNLIKYYANEYIRYLFHYYNWFYKRVKLKLTSKSSIF